MKFLAVLLISFVAGCWAGCTPGTLSPNLPDCASYLQCTGAGTWAKMPCQPGLYWNAAGYCDWPASSGCVPGGNPSPQPTPQPTPQPPKPTSNPLPPSPSGGLITQAQFNCAAATKGGNPDASYYNGFISALPKAQITDKNEAAKFLAHAAWETVGFIYTKEVYCQTNDCSVAYPNSAAGGGLPGKVYYGRGMLQVTWDYNYNACSKYLYGNDYLLKNPDVVANDPAVGWASAAWYWMANVHTRSQTFGSTLKAINGALECDGGSHAQNRVLRFNHYKQILNCLSLPSPPDSDGACSAW